MKNVNWICRELVESPYCIGLCLDKEKFKKELKRLKIPRESWPYFVSEGKDAKVHTFEKRDSNEKCIIVCMKDSDKATYAQKMGLLVHEAVHIWQDICKNINEYEPSSEFEAYSIQVISMRLIAAYDDIIKKEANHGTGSQHKPGTDDTGRVPEKDAGQDIPGIVEA